MITTLSEAAHVLTVLHIVSTHHFSHDNIGLGDSGKIITIVFEKISTIVMISTIVLSNYKQIWLDNSLTLRKTIEEQNAFPSYFTIL